MRKLLVVDDEEAMRKLIRLNLGDTYEISDTGEPEHALAIAMEQRPDTILLDLRMPKYSGYELCRTFTSFGATQHIPVVVISGEGGSKTKDFCRDLGVAAYFEKPIDFDALGRRLEQILRTNKTERRREGRVPLIVSLKLRVQTADEGSSEILVKTENASINGFLFPCVTKLSIGSIVEVFLATSKTPVGTARVMRVEGLGTDYSRYGCRFVHKTGDWVLQ